MSRKSNLDELNPIDDELIGVVKKNPIDKGETLMVSPTKKVKLHIFLGYYPQDLCAETYLKLYYGNKVMIIADWFSKVEEFENKVFG